jgi:hypothetical protein
VQVVAAGLTEVSGDQIEQLFQVRIEGRMQGLLGAQIHADAAALRGRKATGNALQVGERHVSTGGIVGDGHGKQFSPDLLKTRAVSINECLVVQVLANNGGQYGQEQEGIGTRSKLQVNIRLIAVSVRRGSMTTMVRLGSFLMSRSTSRALTMPCD